MYTREIELMKEFDRCDDNIKEFTQMCDLAKYDQSEVDAYIDSQRSRMDEIAKELDRIMMLNMMR